MTDEEVQMSQKSDSGIEEPNGVRISRSNEKDNNRSDSEPENRSDKELSRKRNETEGAQ